MFASTRSLVTAFGVLCGFAVVAPAYAEWPNDKPIKMIVPFPAGGGTDIVGRLVAKHLSDRLKATIYVENRAGANGQIGLKGMKDAPADGYTIATVSDGPLVYNHGLYKERLPYDARKDFAPIGMIAAVPAMLVVHPSVPVKSVAELIALAKEKPTTLNYSSAGYGNFSHLITELFMRRADIKMVHVPTTGAAPAIQAVIQGTVQVHLNNVQTLLPQVQGGYLRALGVAELKPVKYAPDLPSIADTLPGFQMSGYFALIASSETPAAITGRLSDELLAILRDPGVIEALDKQALVPWPMPSADLGRYVAEQIPRWTKIIDEAGIKLQQ